PALRLHPRFVRLRRRSGDADPAGGRGPAAPGDRRVPSVDRDRADPRRPAGATDSRQRGADHSGTRWNALRVTLSDGGRAMNATSHRPLLRWALLFAAAASVGAVVPAGVAAASEPQPATVVIT